jgi:hypothetical protein
MSSHKGCREKITVAVDPAVRRVIQHRADELDCAEATVARHVLSDWARRQAPAQEAA